MKKFLKQYVTKLAHHAHEFGFYSTLAYFENHWAAISLLGLGVLCVVVAVSMLWSEVE